MLIVDTESIKLPNTYAMRFDPLKRWGLSFFHTDLEEQRSTIYFFLMKSKAVLIAEKRKSTYLFL